MINLYPKKCNICGGEVEYITNDKIYGKQYGSGYCYHCKKCGAYVGTHRPRPKQAMGILANSQMRKGKRECHKLFDSLWKGKHAQTKRKECYSRLAKDLNIPVKECHFGYFNLDQLRKAYKIILKWNKEEDND